MDNYKIKVKDEAESKEAQELFEQLGFKWTGDHLENGDWYSHLYAENSTCCYLSPYVWGGLGDRFKELTLPQLRDLVVLKRNDPADGNYSLFISSSQGYLNLYKTSDDVFYVFCSRLKIWDKSRSVTLNTEGLEPKGKVEKDQGLISGAEALRALADGKEVEFKDGEGKWENIKYHMNLDLSMFLTAPDWMSFRLKPQTIKLELEIPAPYKAKIGGRDDTSFVLNVGRHQYLYQNEDDYTKARNALEAVFDAALGGNNS
ncbi:hypothetical protein [Acinetobacter pittii]|uniref:hypothetical protein n=1 Tax=Acinetobacter pittii TaxID=48296 RepID=UPI00237FEB76|nr:hypothetical protein [Acinetobacter pittii]MDE4038798.1 hypothetical protein [Acinetobacter pittii]